EMPRTAAWPLAVLAGAWGLHDALREWRLPARVFELGPGSPGASLDGRPLASAVLRWRGPLAFLYWRDESGQGGWLAWWPDTLPVAERRALRVAATAAPATGVVAP